VHRVGITIVFAVSIAVILPAFVWGIPSSHDLDNHFRFALPFFDAITHGHWYPGWLAESNGGYGDPSFRFYPPAVYYLLSVTRWLTGDWYHGSLVAFTLLSVMSGLGMYYWARSVFSPIVAVWATIFYALAPYHLNQLYQSFLLAEYAACAVLPFAFTFVESLCKKRRMRDVAGLAAAFAVLVLTHLPLTIIGAMALFVYALVRVDKLRWFETFKKFALAIALGLAASAFYWVTMVSELSWIAINRVQVDSSVDYRANFLFSSFSPDNLNVWWMNILAVLALLMLAPAAIFIFRRGADELESKPCKRIAWVLLFTFFMASPLSYPLWKVLPVLRQTQFPWRWLAIFSMFASITTAAAMPAWISNRLRVSRPIILVVAGSVAIAIAFTLSHVVREAVFLSPAQFSDKLARLPGSDSINYWIPIWVQSHPQEMNGRLAAQDRTTSIKSWEPEHRSFEIASGSATEVRVKTFYYPHWTATSEGQVLPTHAAEDGALLISLPQRAATINLDFKEPPRTRLAAILSVLGWFSIGCITVFLRSKER
jgi:hypothetical protein